MGCRANRYHCIGRKLIFGGRFLPPRFADVTGTGWIRLTKYRVSKHSVDIRANARKGRRENSNYGAYKSTRIVIKPSTALWVSRIVAQKKFIRTDFDSDE